MRRHIGVAAQDATLDPLLTGRQNLVLIGELSDLGRAESRARAKELLAQFELTDAADRVVKGYSGGMRRRLDLAGSLMTRPPVLFLDEPTTGLDPTSRQRVWEAIRELLGEGVTVLLTTQYLEEADELAHDIVVVDHGRVIAQGTPQELKEASRGARLEVTLAEPHAGAVGAMAPLVSGPVAVSDDGRHLSAGVDSSTGLATVVVRALDARGSAGGQHRGAAAVARRRVLLAHGRPHRRGRRRRGATGLRPARVRVRAVPLLVPPVPSGPAKAVTNWKEYAHDDRHVDAVAPPGSTARMRAGISSAPWRTSGP